MGYSAQIDFTEGSRDSLTAVLVDEVEDPDTGEPTETRINLDNKTVELYFQNNGKAWQGPRAMTPRTQTGDDIGVADYVVKATDFERGVVRAQVWWTGQDTLVHKQRGFIYLAIGESAG